MRILHLTDQSLSAKAAELIEFDRDSIQRVVASRHGQQPELWLADPAQYEKDGRIQRDSTTPRLLAYSPGARTLYVTDGCNSCSHPMEVDLKSLSPGQLQSFSEDTGISLEMLRKLTGYLSETFVP
jgi:hypothetical protein